MIDDKKLLYTKRYPLDTEGEEAVDGKEPPSFEEMMRRIESAKYIPRPDGAEAARRFTELAKELSGQFELDLDVWEREHDVLAEFHVLTMCFTGASKRRFLALAAMSDEVEIDPPAAGNYTATVSMIYYTHERVR